MIDHNNKGITFSFNIKLPKNGILRWIMELLGLNVSAGIRKSYYPINYTYEPNNYTQEIRPTNYYSYNINPVEHNITTDNIIEEYRRFYNGR